MRERENVIIVHLNINESAEIVNNKIMELNELVRSSGGEVVGEITQNLKKPTPNLYIGKGKADEIKELADNLSVDTIVFNNELTGSQIKNLEDVIDRKIIDRTGLILDIFAQRAQTKEGKLQVKLAQLEYRLPRLVGYRNYLSKEGAGIGTRGPGEQKLEIDRRAILSEIKSIKDNLEKEKNKREIKRKRRDNSDKPIVSLVGYSNVGKSTIMNGLTNIFGQEDKEVFADNMLFATLDTSARSLSLTSEKEIIISDTVGFVSDLPTKLIESFKSTLEEIKISDLIVIVIDASQVDYKMQLDATSEVLKDLDIKEKQTLYCFNKMDQADKIFFDEKDKEVIYISAKEESDLLRLGKTIEKMVFESFVTLDLLIPFDEISNFNRLVNNFEGLNKVYTNQGVSLKISVDKNEKKKFEKYMVI